MSTPPDERPTPRVGEGTDPGVRQLVDRVRRINAENERLFRQLARSEGRFRSLARGVWRVQEEERRRLARELHDGIGQLLAALRHRLDAGLQQTEGASSEVRSCLEDGLYLADQALRDTRELSRLLRPQVLDDLGLEPALRWLVRTLRERAGLDTELEVEGLDERLEPDLETLVFRVAQEALANVLKHADTDRARVEVRLEGDWISLRIEDRGRGFDPAGGDPNADPGSGLAGIRDRVELFGGRLAIDSEPGNGTRIHADVPIEDVRSKEGG